MPLSMARDDVWPVVSGDLDRSVGESERLRDRPRDLEERGERIDRAFQAPRQVAHLDKRIVPAAMPQATGAALQLFSERLHEHRDQTGRDERNPAQADTSRLATNAVAQLRGDVLMPAFIAAPRVWTSRTVSAWVRCRPRSMGARPEIAQPPRCTATRGEHAYGGRPPDDIGIRLAAPLPGRSISNGTAR